MGRWILGFVLAGIALYVQGNPNVIEIPAEACIEMFHTLRNADMICYIADTHNGDGITSYECITPSGERQIIGLGGSA